MLKAKDKESSRLHSDGVEIKHTWEITNRGRNGNWETDEEEAERKEGSGGASGQRAYFKVLSSIHLGLWGVPRRWGANLIAITWLDTRDIWEHRSEASASFQELTWHWGPRKSFTACPHRMQLCPQPRAPPLTIFASVELWGSFLVRLLEATTPPCRIDHTVSTGAEGRVGQRSLQIVFLKWLILASQTGWWQAKVDEWKAQRQHSHWQRSEGQQAVSRAQQASLYYNVTTGQNWSHGFLWK